MTRIVGYTRPLTTDDTSTDADVLREAGASVIFTESVDADPRDRPALAACLAELSAGDVLVVSAVIRLSHSTRHFHSTVRRLTSRGVEVRTLAEPALCTEAIVRSADAVAAIDELSRQIIGLGTRAGIAGTTGSGRRPGRPPVMTDEMSAVAAALREVGRSYSHIADVLGVSAGAVKRALDGR